VTPDELALIQRDVLVQTGNAAVVGGGGALSRNVGIRAAETAGRAWWFYSFWAGTFLTDKFGLNISSLGLPLSRSSPPPISAASPAAGFRATHCCRVVRESRAQTHAPRLRRARAPSRS